MKHFNSFFQFVAALVLLGLMSIGATQAQPIVVNDNTPYTEGFEAGTLGYWTNEIIEGSDMWQVNSEAAHTGARGVNFSSSIFGDFLNFDDIWDLLSMMGDLENMGNGSCRLISPVLNLSDVTGPVSLTFFRKQTTMMIPQYLLVYYRTSQSAQWTVLQQYSSNSAWGEETLTLPNPSGTYQVSFVGLFDTQNMDDIDITSFMDPDAMTNFASNIYIDDIRIGNANTSACDPPQNVAANNVSTNSATITWAGSANNWTVEYGPSGFSHGNGTTLTASTTSQALTGLAAGTAYDVYVRANCAGNTYSNWIQTSFSTATNGINENGAEAFTIAPNPTSGQVRCTFATTAVNCRLQLMDLCGKLLYDKTVDGNTVILDLSDKAAGVYFLRLIDGNDVITTKKLVRR